MEERNTEYIEDTPKWEISTEPLPAYAESAKAELCAQTVSPETWERLVPGCKAMADAWRKAWECSKRITNAIFDFVLMLGAENTKEFHLYKYCKKKRVRKKYKNRLIKKFSEIAKAYKSEADE